MADTTDMLIIGGGVIGMAAALELQTRDPSARIMVLEKEPVPAAHQSGHNTRVIHADAQYRPGSTKVRFRREGVSGRSGNNAAAPVTPTDPGSCFKSSANAVRHVKCRFRRRIAGGGPAPVSWSGRRIEGRSCVFEAKLQHRE